MEIKLTELFELFKTNTNNNTHPYEIGKNYHIRTVTMDFAGKLKAVYPTELVLENASWVADSGRFNEYLRDTSKVNENEPYLNDVIVNRQAVTDATIINEPYNKVK